MNDFFFYLCRTSRICTVIVDIDISDCSFTNRTKMWWYNFFFCSIPSFFYGSNNIRDNFSTSLHSNKIFVSDLFRLYKVKIMKANSRNCCSAKLNRIYVGNRSNDSRPSYLKIHRPNLTSGLLCREFICNSPSWMMFCPSQYFTNSRTNISSISKKISSD